MDGGLCSRLYIVIDGDKFSAIETDCSESHRSLPIAFSHIRTPTGARPVRSAEKSKSKKHYIFYENIVFFRKRRCGN